MNKIYHLKTLILALTLIFFSACSKEDASKEYEVEYKDQDLQGKIGGYPWTILTAFAKDSKYESDKISISLFTSELTEPCKLESLPNENAVFFTIIKQVGTYTLSKGESNSFSITLYYKDDSENFTVISGAVEILEIDSDNNTISCKMDIYFDRYNYLNGNFTINHCN